MKNYKIPFPVFVAVVLVTVLALYAATLPWAREITGGRHLRFGLRSLPFRVYYFFHRPKLLNPHANRIAVSYSRDPNTGQLRQHIAILDSDGRLIEVTPATLPKLSKSQRAAVESFLKQEGVSSLTALPTLPFNPNTVTSFDTFGPRPAAPAPTSPPAGPSGSR